MPFVFSLEHNKSIKTQKEQDKGDNNDSIFTYYRGNQTQRSSLDWHACLVHLSKFIAFCLVGKGRRCFSFHQKSDKLFLYFCIKCFCCVTGVLHLCGKLCKAIQEEKYQCKLNFF